MPLKNRIDDDNDDSDDDDDDDDDEIWLKNCGLQIPYKQFLF